MITFANLYKLTNGHYFINPVFVCFIDAKAAVDRVNHEKLLTRMVSRGVDPRIVGTLAGWFQTQKFCVRWSGILSQPFNVLNGVRQDFEEHLSAVLKDIEDSEFLALDGEFTGLNDGTLGALDTPEERYQKIRTCVNYSLVQFGLVAFFRGSDGYTHKAYNFTVFGGASRRFACNTESLELICTSGFSLDKMIKEGIPYLNVQEEDRLKSKVEEWQRIRESEIKTQQDSDSTPQAIPIDQSEFMSEVFAKVRTFVESTEAELVFRNPTGFQRKLMFQHLRDRFCDLSLESKAIDGSPGRSLHITKRSNKEQREVIKREVDARLQDIEKKIGFSKVVRAISKSGKLLVGHNISLDLIHILHQFIAPAPFVYDDFKLMLRDTFKRFIDTKVVASASPLSDIIPESVLSSIAGLMDQNILPTPKLKDPENGYGYVLKDNKLHNAGFDAYLTGVIFISMIEKLACFSGSSALTKLEEHGISSFSFVEPYLNKIHVMKSLDMKYMNIGGPEVETDRSHVFHLSFPRQWRTADIINLCRPLGYVQIERLDDSSALIIVNDRSKKSEVMSTIRDNGPQMARVTTYAEFMKNRPERRFASGRSPMERSSPMDKPRRDLKRVAAEYVAEAAEVKRKREAVDDNGTKAVSTALPDVFEIPEW